MIEREKAGKTGGERDSVTGRRGGDARCERRSGVVVASDEFIENGTVAVVGV